MKKKEVRKAGVLEEEEGGSDLELDELPDDGIQQKRALYDLFLQRLKSFDSRVLDDGLRGLEELERQKQQQSSMTLSIARNKRDTNQEASSASSSLWSTLKVDPGTSNPGFAFDLCADLEEEESG
jgi:hypothetical protein